MYDREPLDALEQQHELAQPRADVPLPAPELLCTLRRKTHSHVAAVGLVRVRVRVRVTRTLTLTVTLTLSLTLSLSLTLTSKKGSGAKSVAQSSAHGATGG